MKKKGTALLALVLMMSMVLAACGGKAETKTEGSTPSNTSTNAEKGNAGNESEAESGLIKATDPTKVPDAAKARKDTLIIATVDPKGVFNPMYQQTAYDFFINYTLFDTFVEVKADGTYTESLASKVDVSEDGLKYTFHLKPDVKFTDGTPMTVKDYVFTLKMYLDKSYDGDSDLMAYNIVGAKEYNEGKATDISGVKVLDDQTVEVTVSEATALTYSTLGTVPILPEHYYGKAYKQGNLDGVKALNAKPLGSGQYVLKTFKPGQEVDLEANASYFRGAPKIKNVIFKTGTDTTHLTNMTTGATDLNGDIAVTEDNVEELKALGFANINLLPNNGYGYIAFNHKLDKFKDVKVRQALTYGLNRAEIVSAIYGPYAKVINIPQSNVSWSYTDENIEKYDFDMEKAKQLLDEAGWKVGSNGIREKDGKQFSINFTATADNPVVDALLPVMTQNYQELGIKLEKETLDFNAIIDKQQTGDFEMFFAAWGLTPDPDTTTLITDGAQNRIGYSNPKVDELTKKGKYELDLEKRKEIYKELYQEINKDVPTILMYQRSNMVTYSARVDGFDISPYKDYPYSLFQAQLQQ
ncbi:peptide/nickel transport system substrate-binding protein [Paenibacillus turicensis]|uniref:Peptide/nickel transport system substrate-binding protein n=1 Tax=Paenibacillus turicensis TaxID=160487 RepID=A0ABS4FUM2_9BACL|nr:ABC transporter substrate-binding protein [Paenibacillus turicensis]MBP1906277.1 peptide/nickel transport system substrate-binding protein [Paenibacillus turicensis]